MFVCYTEQMDTGRVETYRSWVMFSGVRIIEELSPLAAVLLTTITSPSKRGVEKSHKHLENDCPLALVKEQTVHIRLQNQLFAPDFRTSRLQYEAFGKTALLCIL